MPSPPLAHGSSDNPSAPYPLPSPTSSTGAHLLPSFLAATSATSSVTSAAPPPTQPSGSANGPGDAAAAFFRPYLPRLPSNDALRYGGVPSASPTNTGVVVGVGGASSAIGGSANASTNPGASLLTGVGRGGGLFGLPYTSTSLPATPGAGYQPSASPELSYPTMDPPLDPATGPTATINLGLGQTRAALMSLASSVVATPPATVSSIPLLLHVSFVSSDTT
jgi:hypothetical protein